MTSPYPPSGPGPSNYYAQPASSSPRFNNYAPRNQSGPSSPNQSYQPYPRMKGRGGIPYTSPKGGLPHHPTYAPGNHAVNQPNGFAPQPPQGFSQAQSPYPYQSSPPLHHTPAWAANQTISPLPKQLSMPPPPDMPYYNQIPTQPQHQRSPQSLSPTPSDLPPQTSQQQQSESVPSSPSSRKSSSSTSSASRRKPDPIWVIWSRRPENPDLAPGIIFSTRSKPPPEIVANARELPPPSEAVTAPVEEPKPIVDETPKEPVCDAVESPKPAVDEMPPEPPAPPSESTPPKPPHELPPQLDSTSTVPSSAVTEQTDTPTVASPATSQTSLSVAEKAEKPQEDTTPSSVTPPAPAAPPVKKSWASLLRPGENAATGKPGKSLPKSSVVGFSIPAQAPGEPQPPAEVVALLTSPPAPTMGSVSWMKINPKGLVNTGNMCFANTVLQILLYCPPFYKLFYELGKLQDKPKIAETPLVDATVRFLKEFVPGEKKNDDEDRDDEEPFIPTYVYEALKEKKRFDHMRGGQQEDAEEFFGFYLDTLEEELLSLTNTSNTTQTMEKVEKEEEDPEEGWMEVGKRNRSVVTRTIRSTESPITRIFRGKFRSALRIPGQKDSVVIEDWRSLRLDIQHENITTIQDAILHISDPASIQTAKAEASQKVLVEALPPILVVQMKRFCYDPKEGGVVKVGKQVRFGPELEIPADVLSPTLKKQKPAKYKLFGAVYHHGLSASGGHYTLDVLHPARDMWVRIDDELVSDVNKGDVFDAFDDSANMRCAYLLFYQRVR